MAVGTNIDVQILSRRGTCYETIAAATGDLNFTILGVYVRFHANLYRIKKIVLHLIRLWDDEVCSSAK